MQYCMVCGKPREHVHHALYNTAKRKLATEDKLLIPLCAYHHEDSKNGVHNNAGMKAFSQALAQACWERQKLAEWYTELANELVYDGKDVSVDKVLEDVRGRFFDRYGENYL